MNSEKWCVTFSGCLLQMDLPTILTKHIKSIGSTQSVTKKNIDPKIWVSMLVWGLKDFSLWLEIESYLYKFLILYFPILGIQVLICEDFSVLQMDLSTILTKRVKRIKSSQLVQKNFGMKMWAGMIEWIFGDFSL